MPVAHIGCSGFSYSHWEGTFYPKGLPRRLWLARYSGVLASVELNVTFYRLVNPATFLADGRDVHIYFNNDYNGYAPRNALELAALLA